MSKAKGSRAERKARRQLEADGYAVTRAGGSLGVFDLIAIGPTHVRAIQVKSGTSRLTRAERAEIVAIEVPSNVVKEYRRYRDYARAPVIERLDSALVSVRPKFLLGQEKCAIDDEDSAE